MTETKKQLERLHKALDGLAAKTLWHRTAAADVNLYECYGALEVLEGEELQKQADALSGPPPLVPMMSKS